jgi:hypothetical protein
LDGEETVARASIEIGKGQEGGVALSDEVKVVAIKRRTDAKSARASESGGVFFFVFAHAVRPVTPSSSSSSKKSNF